MPDILTSIEHGVMTLTFNRAEKKNAFTHESYRELIAALQAAADDPAVRVLLVQGNEQIFSAGNDLRDFADSPPQDRSAPVWGFITAIANFPKPIVAAVCGPAVGVGATMLLHCDLVYLGENAKLMLPFTDLGVCPEAASSLLLPALIGARRAAEVFYFAEPILAAEAVELGLANAVLPVTELQAYARQQAQRLAARPRTAILETKRLMKSGLREAVQAQMELESGVFIELLRSPAAKEAFAAFFEGRAPDFARAEALTE